MAGNEGRTAVTAAHRAAGSMEWGKARRLAAALLVALSMTSAVSVVFAGTTAAQVESDAVLQWLPEIQAAASATGVPAEVIAAVGLTEKAATRGDRLSGGQRRRLDVALGIVGRPRLLFLDEPTTGFDPEARRDFWDLIDALKREGTTILLTTHYLEEAEYLADRVAVIARGRVVACDTPAHLGGRSDGESIVAWSANGAPESRATHEPTRVVGELSARFGGEVPGLTVTRPSLEDVYLRLIHDADDDAHGHDGPGSSGGDR